jgi:hypothetical protein
MSLVKPSFTVVDFSYMYSSLRIIMGSSEGHLVKMERTLSRTNQDGEPNFKDSMGLPI